MRVPRKVNGKPLVLPNEQAALEQAIHFLAGFAAASGNCTWAPNLGLLYNVLMAVTEPKE